MSSYGSSPTPPPSPKASKPKKKRAAASQVKMTDKQKGDLKKHMDNHKDLKDMTASQLKSHRMKMMVRMRKGMSISQAHKDIKK